MYSCISTCTANTYIFLYACVFALTEVKPIFRVCVHVLNIVASLCPPLKQHYKSDPLMDSINYKPFTMPLTNALSGAMVHERQDARR